MQQLQQGMAGYAWEPEDWEWRPTWTPSMRAAPAEGAPDALSTSSTLLTVCNNTNKSSSGNSSAAAGAQLLAALDAPPGSTPQQQLQVKLLLAQLTRSLAELEAPQRGLRLLQDTALLDWYQNSIRDAVDSAAAAAAGTVAPPTVLVLANGGGGLLALLAAAAGAGRVVVVEKWRWGCRASKQLLEANRAAHPELVGRIELVAGPLSSCYFAPAADAVDSAASQQRQQQEAKEEEQNGDGSSGRFRLSQQADVVVTGMFDYRWVFAECCSFSDRAFG